MNNKSFVVFSDLHLHEHSLFSSEVNGENIFVNIVRSVIGQIGEYVEKNNVPIIIHTGDLYHTRNRIPVKLISIMQRLFQRCFFGRVQNLFLLRGNPYHDGDGDNYCGNVFSIMADIKSISDPIMFELLPGINGFFLPYMPKQNLLEAMRKMDIPPKGVNALKIVRKMESNRVNILFLHHALKGARILDYESKDEESLSREDLKRFDYVFAGHYHKYQEVWKNAYHVGSPYRISFAEADDPKGFLHYDDGKVKFIELDVPMMVQRDIQEGKGVIHFEHAKNSFYKYVIIGSDSYLKNFDYTALKCRAIESGALGVRFETKKIEDQDGTREARINRNDNPENMLEQYLNYVKDDIGTMDARRLKKIGLLAMRQGVEK